VGQRANIIVIQDGKYDLYYCHWCAVSLPADLFWGPEPAVAFARNQLDARSLGPEIPMRRPDISSRSVGEPREPGAQGWLDDQWAEGGAVIDLDYRVLILFGGDDISCDVPLRRLYLELLRQVWSGWEVRWAHLGILDLADYVGLPRKLVMRRAERDAQLLPGLVDPHRPMTIGSLLLEDQEMRLFPLRGDVLEFLCAGPRLVESAREESGYASMPLDEWGGWLPMGGFHIDVHLQRVDFWSARTLNADPEAVVAGKWPGWRLHWLEDDFEAQLARLGDRVCWPWRSMDRELSWVGNILMNESSAAPTEATMQAMLDQARQEGQEPELGLKVRTGRRLQLTTDLRKQVFEQAVTNWRLRQQTSEQSQGRPSR
jgi:hypothetical protein